MMSTTTNFNRMMKQSSRRNKVDQKFDYMWLKLGYCAMIAKDAVELSKVEIDSDQK